MPEISVSAATAVASRFLVVLLLLLLCDVIDSGLLSTSQHPSHHHHRPRALLSKATTTTSSITREKDHQQSSTATSANSFTTAGRPRDNGPHWLDDGLKDISYYLRAHKFNEYDRRYVLKEELASRMYYAGFPRPPLRSLHWEVHKFCAESFLECVDYLRRKIRGADMKRADDTAVVMQEQQWTGLRNLQQIEIVDKECQKMRRIDDVQANPFEGPIERFQWRVTASYYMCWYTMKSEPSLKHLSDRCDNFAHCLDSNRQPNNGDVRANDDRPFACALYSFCPDPCCPTKHLTKLENCWNKPDNPCFEANYEGQRECVVNRSMNTDFSDTALNRWNVTCHCQQPGFVWSSFYGICIDINECAEGHHNCDLTKEACFNLPGSFKCICKWGHVYNSTTHKCSPSSTLIQFILPKRGNETDTEKKSIWKKIVGLFSKSPAATPFVLTSNSCMLITAALFSNIKLS